MTLLHDHFSRKSLHIPTASSHLQGLCVAAATSVAVKEVVSAPDAADTARLAVELQLLEVVIKEAALKAAVGAKLDAAAGTHGRHRLPQIAQRTHQLPHCGAIKLVPLAGVLQTTQAIVRIVSEGHVKMLGGWLTCKHYSEGSPAFCKVQLATGNSPLALPKTTGKSI